MDAQGNESEQNRTNRSPLNARQERVALCLATGKTGATACREYSNC
jgi:hypothetical protein